MADSSAVASEIGEEAHVGRETPVSLSKIIGLVAAPLAALLILALPQADGLSAEGKRMAAVFVGCLILWVTEPIPVPVTALLALIAQPIFRITTLPSAFGNFMTPVFFWVLVMFIIAQALRTTGLDRRFALFLISRAGTDPRRITLAFMIGCGMLSAIMSDIPASAIFTAVALSFFTKMGLIAGKSKFAKAVMLGIPIGSLIGGIASPTGSSINIMGMYFIEQYGKVKIPFLSWMAIGLPLAIILIPFAWWVLTRFYPAEMSSVGTMDEVRAERKQMGRITRNEWKVIAVLASMLALYILGTWVKQLDIILVGFAGAIVLFMPGIKVLNWKQAEKAVGWDALLMIGGVTSLGAASVKTGLAGWLVSTTIGGIGGLSVFWVIVAICAFTVISHLLVPINPAIIAAFVPPLAMLAQSTGHNPALFTLPVAFTASCAFLLPLDAVPLVTYGKGYYRMFDMFLPGAIISAAWVIVITAIFLFLANPLGLM